MSPAQSIAREPCTTMKPLPDKVQKRRLIAYVAFAVIGVGFILFLLFVHPFLAVTKKVDADILVIEGWIPDYMAAPAASEFQSGHYAFVMISGLQNDPDLGPRIEIPETQNPGLLEKFGIPSRQIVPCPAPYARWLRTSKTAQAVRHKIEELGLKSKGINVVTAGPHARETWVAYQHVFGDRMPVGIISIPKKNYPADRWWLSRQGLIWVSKDFIAWLKEVIFGLRS
jgi:hypothetical protein